MIEEDVMDAEGATDVMEEGVAALSDDVYVMAVTEVGVVALLGGGNAIAIATS